MDGIMPEDTFEFSLPADEALPAERRRVLVYRHGNAAKWLRWSKRARQLAEERDWAARLEGYVALLSTDLVRSRNVGLVEDLLEHLNQADLVIAAESVPSRALLSELEKKESSSRTRSGTGSSAQSAEREAADAREIEG